MLRREKEELKGELTLIFVSCSMFTGTNCLVRLERLPVVVYTDVLAPFHVRFIFRQPPLSYVSNIFSLPFSTGVWVAMAICTALSAASLYLASRWEVTLGKVRITIIVVHIFTLRLLCDHSRQIHRR